MAMAPQTAQASPSGIEKAEALRREHGWTQEDLAEKSGASRAVVINFLKGRPVRLDLFKCIAGALEPEADWKEFTRLEQLNSKQDTAAGQESEVDVESIVQRFRGHVAPEIQKRCGVMRVLDMTQPIDSTAIYTDVNILERVASKSRADLKQLQEQQKAENFEHFGLMKVKEGGISGLEALARHRLIMILGKPGSGKTTFLKRLAMWCRASKQGQDNKVPIFITLKEFADDRRKHETLIDFVADSYELQESAAVLKALLEAGRALVMLDGLDEVQNAEHERVLAAIREFSRKYDQSQIIITCRIAATEYIFEQFTEVQMADFNNQQIQDFANKWFLTHLPNKVDTDGKSIVGKYFWKELSQNEPVRKLARNPLLLTLLCLEFGEDLGFPKSRAELYDRGLNILLSKWDKKRWIERNKIHEKLTVSRKKALLAQLAWVTFEKGDYFFKQSVVESHISQYIQSLPGASEDKEVSTLDSTAVLDAIEAHHGLLSQRATNIYSFSHLTFHEYFAASKIAESMDVSKKLLGNLHNKRWYNFFILLFEKLDDPDQFILYAKHQNDSSISSREKLIDFLKKVENDRKRFSRKTKPYADRAYWSNHYLRSAIDIESESKFSSIGSNQNFLHWISARSSPLNEILGFSCDLTKDGYWEQERALPSQLQFDYGINIVTDLNDFLNLGVKLNPNASVDFEYLAFEVFRRAIRKAHTDDFKDKLKYLLEDLTSNFENIRERSWTERLRQALIQHCNVGQYWEFSNEELKSLHNYYYGSKLIIDCLKSECNVSNKVRQQIEDTLLVPPD